MRGPAAAWGIAALVCLAPACVQVKTRPTLLPRDYSVELRRHVAGVGYQGVVFTPLGADGEPLLGFSPSDLDIANMEARLPTLLAGRAAAFGGSPPLLEAYLRQYMGHATDGRRVLQTNFIERRLVEERGIDWRNQRVTLNDAGRRFFQTWYDVGGRHIVQLIVSSS